MSDFVLNIFQEQFNLIDNLPDNEKKEVLYHLIQSKFNQDDCLEKQSSLSLSISLSKLSISVIDIINKTMHIKEINQNHGGARKGAGAKKGNQNAKKIIETEPEEKQSRNNQETIKLIDFENKEYHIGGQQNFQFALDLRNWLKKQTSESAVEKVEHNYNGEWDIKTGAELLEMCKAQQEKTDKKEILYLGEMGLVKLTPEENIKVMTKCSPSGKSAPTARYVLAIRKINAWMAGGTKPTERYKPKNKTHYGLFADGGWLWDGLDFDVEIQNKFNLERQDWLDSINYKENTNENK